LQAARIEAWRDKLDRLSKKAAKGGSRLLKERSDSFYLEFGHQAFGVVLPLIALN
jgi:hypothetical protein